MTTQPPPRTDPQGRLWTWDTTQDCYRHDHVDGTWFSTKAEVDEQHGLGPEFRAVLVKVASGELSVDEAIGLTREMWSP